jgi:hypothetical protein
MSCDACKRIQVLTGSPCRYCGRLNVEAELAVAQLRRTREPAPQPPADAATASDEAVVREIAEELGWSSFGVLDGDSPVMRLALRAFAAGRAAEREACIAIARDGLDGASPCAAIADAIARRGGK